MKQIAIISGKGGTGKTVISAALAGLAKNSAIMVDCDVDAPDLYLILNPEIKKKHEFIAGKEASIDLSKCKQCGKCIKNCRFDAISRDFIVDPISCEGCGVCYRVCPAGAVNFTEKLCGHYFISDTRFGQMVHAQLGIAEENSGKLVSSVRNKALELSKSGSNEYIIIDGPPGIACSVIAAITGVNLVLVVTEPTLSGIHDLKRVVDLAKKFRIKSMVCINKYDINLKNAAIIEDYCRSEKISVAGKICFDKGVTESIINKKTIIEYDSASLASKEINNLWNKIK